MSHQSRAYATNPDTYQVHLTDRVTRLVEWPRDKSCDTFMNKIQTCLGYLKKKKARSLVYRTQTLEANDSTDISDPV